MQSQCFGITRKNERCLRQVKLKFCGQHSNQNSDKISIELNPQCLTTNFIQFNDVNWEINQEYDVLMMGINIYIGVLKKIDRKKQ
jgi:hypothetical protein